jgi:tRNA modification GTPase
VAIVGATNVGKSTLLNALLGEERAIVSDIHGTTRDSIEDTITLNGVQFRFIDTAGIRHTAETIEQLGIDRTYEKIRQAAIVLLVLDATRSETFATIEEIKTHLREQQQLMVVLNKTDLQESSITNYCHCEEAEGRQSKLATYELQIRSQQINKPTNSLLCISAKHKQGIDKLIAALAATVNLSPVARNETVLTNVRHYEALCHAEQSIIRILEGLDNDLSGDLLAQDIHECLHCLGEITGGEIAADEVLGNIFSKFCIGK